MVRYREWSKELTLSLKNFQLIFFIVGRYIWFEDKEVIAIYKSNKLQKKAISHRCNQSNNIGGVHTNAPNDHISVGVLHPIRNCASGLRQIAAPIKSPSLAYAESEGTVLP